MKAVSILAILVAICYCSCKQIEETPTLKLRGMYKLDRFDGFDSITRQWRPSENWAGYSGYIIYDGLGHMAVHLSPKGYKDGDVAKNIDSLNPEELIRRAKLYQSNYTYFANVSANDSTVVHSKLSATNPLEWGTDATRDFIIDNDTLYLATREKQRGERLRLKWIKMH